MSNKQEKHLRDRYFDNEIFRIGDIVEDTNTKEEMKILDRGSNYITVATSNGVVKKWLSEVVEKKESLIINEQKEINDPDFKILESGQIKLFGHETRNFNKDLSVFVLEQFQEFDDLFSKHQIIKCMDMAISEMETDSDHAYQLLDKVEKFYSTHNISSPFIVEGLKTDIERKRIAEIMASVAGIKPAATTYQTVVDSIKELKNKYKTKQQWEVLAPFMKLAQDSGLTGINQNLPFGTKINENETPLEEQIRFDVMDENVDLVVEDLDDEDIFHAFEDEDFYTNGELNEGLSIETRAKLSRKMGQRAGVIAVKRERAMSRAANSDVIMARARKLAETMIKRRIFHKSPLDLTRQDKERFEAGAFQRRSLIARLAMKLIPKVRALQSARLHHQDHPASKTVDTATAKLGNGAA